MRVVLEVRDVAWLHLRKTKVAHADLVVVVDLKWLMRSGEWRASKEAAQACVRRLHTKRLLSLRSRWMKMGFDECSQFMPSAASLAIFMRCSSEICLRSRMINVSRSVGIFSDTGERERDATREQVSQKSEAGWQVKAAVDTHRS